VLSAGLRGRRSGGPDCKALKRLLSTGLEIRILPRSLLAMLVSMSDESDSKLYEERAWQYFLQLQPSIADVNAAAELAFRAVDAFDKGLKRRRGQQS
jgi:hypothetical protein